MVMVVLLVAATALQLAACFQAIRLIRVTRHLLAWELLAGGMFLILVLRFMLLAEVPLHATVTATALSSEVLRLAMSLLLLAGVSTIGPVFRKMAEREEKLRLFRELLDHARDAIFVVEPGSGRILDVNEGACALLGYTREELLELTVPQTLVGFEEPGAWQEAVERYRREGNLRLERTVRRKNGTTCPAESWISLVRRNGHEYEIAVVRDITARKRAERLTARHAQELARSNYDLEQFASVVSHDLGAPLSVIAGLAQVLERQGDGQLGEQSKDWLRRIVREVDHMGKMIDGLLGYARVTSWGRPLGPVDCGAAYEEALENVQPLWEADATVTRGELPTVNGDQVQLVELFQNLIGNALKYRGEDAPRVHLSCERVGGAWQISVADNGVGVDEEEAGRIFEVFQRGGKGDRPGAGLGLAICRRIVQRHGGQIWVEPNEGGGSKFCFTLPAEEHATVLAR
jgi:PAS domain S-box-containing protein